MEKDNVLLAKSPLEDLLEHLNEVVKVLNGEDKIKAKQLAANHFAVITIGQCSKDTPNNDKPTVVYITLKLIPSFELEKYIEDVKLNYDHSGYSLKFNEIILSTQYAQNSMGSFNKLLIDRLADHYSN